MTPLQQFEDYTVLGEIDRGGMGVVYQAVHRGLNRSCALKVLRTGLLASDHERRRFLTEAEAAAKLDHPNIVRVGRAIEYQGQWLLEMELVEGGTLADRIAGASLIPSETARLVGRIARAVQHAHERGVLHRDLKPSNILLGNDGQPKLTDFGLARFLERESDLTRTVAVLGTPAYLAPEVASGRAREATTKVDIYSLGVVLFECLTGQRPFAGETALEILRAVQEGPVPSPQRLRPDIPTDLEIICLKCLHQDPAARYASAADLADDLDRWLRHEPIAARPPTAWERLIGIARRHPIRTGLVGLLGLSSLLFVTFLIASLSTYFWLMGKVADEHLIVPALEDGTFLLHLTDETGKRCTYNFWKMPFGSYYNSAINGRYARLEFQNMPSEQAENLQVRVWSDIPGYPDIPRTGALTNRSTFTLSMGQRRERAFYFTEENFVTSNLLARFPDAAIRVTLLGFPDDPNPFQPTGKLHPRERQ